MYRKYFLGLLLVLAGLIWVFSFREHSREIYLGGKMLKVEIARTEAQKMLGLSGRQSLCENCGMVFVYDTPGFYPFWMPKMHFDIDIVWIKDNRVVDITQNVPKPLATELDAPKQVYQPKTPVNKVLEVNSGWVEKNGVKIGDVFSF